MTNIQAIKPGPKPKKEDGTPLISLTNPISK